MELQQPPKNRRRPRSGATVLLLRCHVLTDDSIPVLVSLTWAGISEFLLLTLLFIHAFTQSGPQAPSVATAVCRSAEMEQQRLRLQNPTRREADGPKPVFLGCSFAVFSNNVSGSRAQRVRTLLRNQVCLMCGLGQSCYPLSASVSLDWKWHQPHRILSEHFRRWCSVQATP